MSLAQPTRSLVSSISGVYLGGASTENAVWRILKATWDIQFCTYADVGQLSLQPKYLGRGKAEIWTGQLPLSSLPL